MGFVVARADFALRTDDQVAYGRLVAEGAGVGFVAALQPSLLARVASSCRRCRGTLPCWLAVHREIRSNPLVRTAYDFLAREIPPAIRG